MGWRQVAVTERRTALDVAHQLRRLVDVDFPDATVIRLVWDNLNVHRLSVLYDAFAPAEARRLARRLDLHPTPKHASWLNMAELELSVLDRQCLAQRLPSRAAAAEAVAPWQAKRNAAKAKLSLPTSRGTCRSRAADRRPW